MFGIPFVYLKLVAAAALAAVLFGSGWKVKGWKDDAEKAATHAALQEAVKAFHDHELKVGALLETKLASLRANQTIVEKHRETITERPVYRNQCLDDAGVRLIDAARRGAAPASEPAAAVP